MKDLLRNGIRPLSESGSDFSECILKDLIKEGYEGEELLLKFKEMKKKIRPAVKELIKEADELAKAMKEKYLLMSYLGRTDIFIKIKFDFYCIEIIDNLSGKWYNTNILINKG